MAVDGAGLVAARVAAPRLRGVRAAAALVAVLLALGAVPARPASAQSAQEEAGAPVPDQLDPPAAGEADYADDPSEPELALRSAAAPGARIDLSGLVFGPQAVEALAGADRVDTAVLASRAGWPGAAPGAVLVSGDAFPDALAAAGLAGVVGGPLLLTGGDVLDGRVADELRRLAPETVTVVGAVPPGVVDGVRALAPDDIGVEVIRAEDRFATAFEVAQRSVELGADPSTLLVANGEEWADALSASALAAGLRHPLLLTAREGMRDRLAGWSAELGATRHWVVGGPAAVSDSAIEGLPGDRVFGADRYATAEQVAVRGFAFGLDGAPVLASGEAFPDGLAGGVLAGARRAPLLLTARRELPAPTMAFLGARGLGRLTRMGGAAVASPFLDCQLRTGETRGFLCVEEEMQRQGFHVGAVDGSVDRQTVWSIFALDKAVGLPADRSLGELELQRLLDGVRLVPRRPDLGPDHVEIDIARQLVLVVREGEVRHILHTSTGKRSTPTVRGVFTVYEKRNVRQANRMYRPVFFYRGYAFHGYPEIPLHPASAGCARMYDGDMDFLWPFLPMGHRIASY